MLPKEGSFFETSLTESAHSNDGAAGTKGAMRGIALPILTATMRTIAIRITEGSRFTLVRAGVVGGNLGAKKHEGQHGGDQLFLNSL